MDVDLLVKHPFFKGFSIEHLRRVARNSRRELYQAGDYVIREGQSADDVYIILSGSVRILTEEYDDFVEGESAPVCIQALGAGEILGWSWLIPPYAWRFDGKASEDTEVVAISANCLRELSEEDPKAGYLLLSRVIPIILDRLVATRMELATHHAKGFERPEGG